MRFLLLMILVAVSPSFANSAPLHPAEKSAVCQQRAQCQVERIYPAGKTAKGAPLRVVKTVLALSKEELQQAKDDFSVGCRASNSDQKNGGEEYWLLQEQQPPQKILALCNDGYGAAGVGEDIVTVGNNRFIHTQAGGSASRWESTVTLSLSPLQKISLEGCNFHTLDPIAGETIWETYTPLMTVALVKDRTFPQLEEKFGPGCPGKIKSWQWKPQPKPGVLAGLQIPRPNNTYEEQGLAISSGTALGSCGVEMSVNGTPGFLVFGKADPQRTGYVRALVPADNTLLVQIYDSHTDGTTTDNWVHTDHIEIWTGTELDVNESVRPPVNKLTQIGITLDGQVHRGIGTASLPKVEVWTADDEQHRRVRVLRIYWSQESALAYGFLLAYSQAKAGKQVRLVANAGVTRNQPDYLPSSKAITARCRVENQQVNLIREVTLPLEQ